MSLKCQKYLNKLANTDVNDSKFGLYLTKLNYWYEQVGGDIPQQNCKEGDKWNGEKCPDGKGDPNVCCYTPMPKSKSNSPPPRKSYK